MTASTPRRHTVLPTLAALAATVATLSACGGGGAADTPAAAAPATAVPEPAAAAAPAAPAEPAPSPAPAPSAPPAETVTDAPVPMADEAPTEFALSASPSPSPGTPGYYVDALRGADTNDGSHDRPWKTLAKLSSARASASMPIYLRCDGVWRESLKLSNTQLAAGSVIQAYGGCSGSTAVISGADDVSGGWTKSGNAWSRNIGGGRNVTQLFIDGKAHRIARWPNAPASGDGYALTVTPASASSTTMTLAGSDAATLAGKDLANAQLQLRTGGASSAALLSSSLDSARALLALVSAAPRSVGADEGYVLQNKRWMLDAPGEYHYDNGTGLLTVYPFDAAPQADLNGARVEASVRDSAIEISFTSGVTLRGIGVVKARQNGIRVYDAANTTLASITGMDNGRAGVAVIASAGTGSAGSVVQDGVFLRNTLYGIDASGATGVTVRNNSVRDTGMGVFVGQPMAAIWGGPGNTIDGNTVQRSGLTAIRFSGAAGSKVTRNVVLDSCLRFADCGAIYSWNGPKRSDSAANQSSLVQGNVVTRAPTAMTGSGTGAPNFNVGIYLDDYSAGATVSGNWVFDLPVGIMLHNTSRSTVSGNRIAGAGMTALWANMDDSSVDQMTGNTWENNQIVPVSVATGSYPATPQAQRAYVLYFWHKTLGTQSIRSGGNVFRGNDIVQVNDTAIPVAYFHGGDGDQYLLGAAWSALTGGLDPLPRSPSQYALYLPVLGGELVPNGGFDGGLGGWTSWFANVGGSYGSVGAASLAGCSATCARFAALSINDTMISPPFAMSPGALYQVSYSASFLSNGSASRPGFVGTTSKLATTTSVTSSSMLNGLAGQTMSYTGMFTATSGEASTLRLAAGAGTTVGYDNVSVRPVTNFSTAKPADWVRTAYTGNSAASIGCNTLGWPGTCRIMDVDGRELALPFTLPAFSAKTVLRADSGWRTR